MNRRKSHLRRRATPKWDLHVHTPASILNNQFPRGIDHGPDWETYVAAVEATDVAVLGATDYFTIDGYKVLRAYQEKGRLQDTALLPNIEFRLDTFVASRKDGERQRRLNFHVIFSEEVLPQDIEEHFLHDIYFNYGGTPGDKNDRRKLKGAALLRRRPQGALRAARQELLDPSKAWWGGRRGRLADRRCYPISVSPGVVPLVLALRGSPGTREVAAGS